jgi:hypothetical protein
MLRLITKVAKRKISYTRGILNFENAFTLIPILFS